MTVAQLKDQCKTKKIKIPAKSKRDDIIKLLENKEDPQDEPQEELQEFPMKVLGTTGNYKKIYQISDIHIRPTNDRNDEFQQVFDKFAAEVPKNDETLITITGDIFDKKNGLTPENILLARDFFYKLGQKAPVFIILGNHDTILQDITTDSLSAVLHLIPNVYYLKYSGFYEFGNVVFAVSSLLDNKVCRIGQKDPSKVYVSMYHGTITGSLMFNGTSIKEDSLLKLGDFGNFDLLLLGDIHKMQFFQSNAAYPGSLVQQNFGESINNHGYIQWDLEKKEGKFNEIKSDYAFITIVCKDSKITVPVGIEHVNNVYLRVFYPNNDKENYNLSSILSKFNVIYLREEFGSVDRKVFQDNVVESKVLSKEELMKEFLVEKGYPKEIIEGVLKFDKEISTKEIFDTNKPTWGLNNIKFKNVFIYGGDKEYSIDFNSNTGFMKIFGTNAIGKSTITNIVTFGVFGEVNDMDLMDVPHNGASNAYVHLEIQVGSYKYQIKRNIKTKGKNNTVCYHSCTLEKDNQMIASSAAQVKQKIEELIGTYEEFELTSLISNKHIGLLNLKPIDRHKIICKLLKLDNYKKLEDLAKAKRKDNDRAIDNVTGALEILQDSTPEKIAELKDKISEISSITYNYQETEKVSNKILRRREKIESLTRQIFPIHANLTDYTIEIDSLRKSLPNKTLKEINASIAKNQKDIGIKMTQIKPVQNYKMTESIEVYKSRVERGINSENYQPKYDRIVDLITQQRRKLFKLELVDNPTDKLLNKMKEFKRSKRIYTELDEKSREITNKILELYKSIINVNFSGEIDTSEAELLPEIRNELLQVVNNWQVNVKYQITDELKSKFLKLLNDNGLSLIKNLVDNNKLIQKEISELEKEKDEIVNQMKTYKLSELEREVTQLEMLKEKYEKYVVDKIANDEIEERLSLLEDDLKKIKEKLAQQVTQNEEYNEAIKIIESEEARKTNKNLQKEISLLHSENEKLNEYSEKIRRLEELEKLQNDYKLVEEKKVNNEKLNSEIAAIKVELQTLEEKMEKIREYNTGIDIQKAQNESQIEALQSKLNSLNQDFNQKVALQEKLAEHKKLGNIYDIYISVVNASCLPSIILDKHIPVLEKAVNDILTPMTSFQIKITIKGSTIVFRHIKSTGTDITISACSGYEYFMLNLALKMSLAKFGYIPFPSFISIDEGWDVVSESNYSKLQKMFDTLYSLYRNIIVISHLPKVQYMLESYTGTSITIQNVNGISSIV